MDTAIYPELDLVSDLELAQQAAKEANTEYKCGLDIYPRKNNFELWDNAQPLTMPCAQ